MALNEVLEKPSIGEICAGMIMYLGAVWIAFLVGLIVGWTWKPKWASFRRHKFLCSLYNSDDSTSPPLSDLENTSDEKPKPSASAASRYFEFIFCICCCCHFMLAKLLFYVFDWDGKLLS